MITRYINRIKIRKILVNKPSTTSSIYLPFWKAVGFLFSPPQCQNRHRRPGWKWYLDITRWPFFSYFRHARHRRRDVKVYSISSKVAEIHADTAVIWDIPPVSPVPDADVHLMIISTIATPFLRSWRGKGRERKHLSIGRSRLPISISRSRLSYLFHSLISAVHFRCMMNNLSLSLRPRG